MSDHITRCVPGGRFSLHPASDFFMRGIRYGTALKGTTSGLWFATDSSEVYRTAWMNAQAYVLTSAGRVQMHQTIAGVSQGLVDCCHFGCQEGRHPDWDLQTWAAHYAIAHCKGGKRAFPGWEL